ncbi:MAG: chitobiase/beta-hexosaminidase C-terminal domain-containing protein [Lachnospiraceae bacterium]|nr:chitobiase/beta-hexosaminidase C-terminal domain-containing protein [Lachnospiraceae bacterium]
MDCPKCGFILIDDRWICENCGAEIQMVPDFEPELENSISEVLLNVADEINPGRKEEVPEKTEEIIPKPKLKKVDNNNKLKRYLIITLSILVFLSITIPVSISIYRNNSAPYQISRARVYEEMGDYENAILRIKRADRIRPNDAEIRLLWAAYCFSNEDYDKAVEILLEMISSPRFTWAEKDICYDNIIFIWHMMGKYQEINDLVRASRDESLITEYQHYLSWPPVFGEESGEFNGSLLLELRNNAEGKIYFTLDGTEPTAQSRVYTEPILLEAGDYTITAVFENKFGILSDIVSQNYFINIKKPDSPGVPLSSGRYIEQELIIVDVPEGSEVFFTTDGSLPTMESELYEGPVTMALGYTVYNFIAINAEGVSSEVVTREFNFRLNSDITPETAVANVFNAQLRRGRIVSLDGKAMDEEGYFDYVIDSVIEIAGKGLFYMIYEYYYLSGEEPQRTGHIFAASAFTGEAAHLIYNDLGVLDAINI